jgi:hypothetical protein
VSTVVDAGRCAAQITVVLDNALPAAFPCDYVRLEFVCVPSSFNPDHLRSDTPEPHEPQRRFSAAGDVVVPACVQSSLDEGVRCRACGDNSLVWMQCGAHDDGDGALSGWFSPGDTSTPQDAIAESWPLLNDATNTRAAPHAAPLSSSADAPLPSSEAAEVVGDIRVLPVPGVPSLGATLVVHVPAPAGGVLQPGANTIVLRHGPVETGLYHLESVSVVVGSLKLVDPTPEVDFPGASGNAVAAAVSLEAAVRTLHVFPRPPAWSLWVRVPRSVFFGCVRASFPRATRAVCSSCSDSVCVGAVMTLHVCMYVCAFGVRVCVCLPAQWTLRRAVLSGANLAINAVRLAVGRAANASRFASRRARWLLRDVCAAFTGVRRVACTAGFEAAATATAVVCPVPTASVHAATSAAVRVLRDVDGIAAGERSDASPSGVQLSVQRGSGRDSEQLLVTLPASGVPAVLAPGQCPVLVIDWLLHAKDAPADGGGGGGGCGGLDSPPALSPTTLREFTSGVRGVDCMGVALMGSVPRSRFSRSTFALLCPRLELDVVAPIDATFQVAFMEQRALLQVRL